MMKTTILLFTRDLRVHDHPALHAACADAENLVPLFVLDDALLSSPAGAPNRVRFLLDGLDDLRKSLHERGAELVVRRGDPVTETLALARRHGAGRVHLSDDVSAYAARRRERLEREIAVAVHPGVTVVPPGTITPVSGDHYKVFTPYFRAWSGLHWRPVLPAPEVVRVPPGLEPGVDLGSFDVSGVSPGLIPGGEGAGRERVRAWLRDHLADYEDGHDDLPGDRTSRLSPYLRFGCVSPLELATAARARTGGYGFARQLAWRDFHHQVTAAFPRINRDDYRPRDAHWHDDEDALEAWRQGRTGYPIVDAGMRQLLYEGFMHNRARMITASFLTRNLRIDWRHGLRHFASLLADGDVPNNAGNWQWIAGTGNDTRPNRVMNPLRQASRFDPKGDYVRTYVPELEPVSASFIHTPWKLPAGLLRDLGYPAPIIDPLD